MRGLYPPIEPFDVRRVAVGDGHEVYVEQCGNPEGKPALVLHGGPGSGCTIGMRRFFDPARYRIVLLDQRGSGRSSPLAGEADADLSTNTSKHLLADLEMIRNLLEIERWLLYGHSWGSALGLAYAVQHSAEVSEVVFSGVAIGDAAEIRWLYRDCEPLRPEAFRRFRDGVANADEDDLITSYAKALFAPNTEVQARAAYAFSEWDWSSASAIDQGPMRGRFADPMYRLTRARIATHYFRNDCWIDSEALLAGARGLGAIPAVLVNGELDLKTPARSAQRLAATWPGAELVVVAAAGHATSDDGMEEAIVAATDRFVTG